MYWQYETCHRIGWQAAQGNGERGVALAISEVRGIVQRACAGQDILDACARRDLGTVITLLRPHGVTQGQVSALTGIPQVRLSEYVTRKREPRATSTFEKFADGLGMPPAARRALGLASAPSPAAEISLIRPGEAAGLDAGLEYPGTPIHAAENVSVLWRADLDDPAVLERGLITPAAWSDASLRWLVAPSVIPGDSDDRPGGARVGLGDVQRFRDTVAMFRELDDRFGGGHARDALIRYLQGDAVRLLRGRHPDSVGSALLSSVAEATQLGGFSFAEPVSA